MKYFAKVVDLFKTSWGEVAVLEFNKDLTIKLGMVLSDTNANKWEITRVSNSKAPHVEKYKDKINSIYVWDCTLKPVGHSDSVKTNDVLEVVG